MRLKDKVAMVTGAGSGNGRAIAVGFAKEGAKVVLVDINDLGSKETAEEIKKMGGDSFPITADVINVKEVADAVQQAMSHFGTIDILVNNAGIFTKSPFLEFDENVWDRTIQVNLKGAFVCGQKAALEMKKSGKGGAIINISSINGGGEAVRPSAAAYASSKGGIKSLTKVMAVDLAPYKIRVNAIAPGFVRTPMTDGLWAKEGGQYLPMILDRIPLKRIAEPEELVGPAIFLASDDASYVTGAILFVDGGWPAYS
jgi:NAD(P)-dependent dehydrogenase (short-subunit alcohol dehydrogenase family)